MENELFSRIRNVVEDSTLERSFSLGFENAQKNKPHFRDTVKDLAGAEKGKTCLVVGAGPSLIKKKSLERAKAFLETTVVVATDGSLGHCLRRGIVPQYVISLDPHEDRIVRWFGDEDLHEEKLQDDYFKRQDLDAYLNTDEVKKNEELIRLVNEAAPRMKAILSTSASQSVVKRCLSAGIPIYWWNPIYDDFSRPESVTRKLYETNRVPCMNAGGNCGTAAWVFASRVLGARKAVLIGFDLGYYADTPFLNTQYYRIFEGLMKPEEIPTAFKFIRNPYLNEDYYTDPVYHWYMEGFLELARQVPSTTTVNATEGGILFGDGITWSGLEDALANR